MSRLPCHILTLSRSLIAVVVMGTIPFSCSRSKQTHPLPDGFYIWQRVWHDGVREAVAAESGPLFPLACEIRTEEAVAEWAHTDWQCMAGRSNITPVVRVDVQALGSPNLRRVIADVARILDSTPACEFNGLQLDVDCPERRLAEYTDLLTWLAGQLPSSWELSITALPCHLHRKEFRNLIRPVSYYVVQVHGLEIPRHIDAPTTLMDLEVARRAIARAETLDRPFRLALPCYGYRMSFDPSTGAFSHLSAEGPEAKAGEMLTRILQPDPSEVAALVPVVRAESERGPCRGIVWFRLPVPGDRLAWDRDTVRALQEGRLPAIECRLNWSRTHNGTWELLLKNCGILGEREATVHLEWSDNRGSGDALQPYTFKEHLPGILPAAIRGPLPRPGMERKIAWFRLAADQAPESEVAIGPAPVER